VGFGGPRGRRRPTVGAVRTIRTNSRLCEAIERGAVEAQCLGDERLDGVERHTAVVADLLTGGPRRPGHSWSDAQSGALARDLGGCDEHRRQVALLDALSAELRVEVVLAGAGGLRAVKTSTTASRASSSGSSAPPKAR
jgi:hypothetical protein